MAYRGPHLSDDESFRVLQLQPGNAEEPVRFTLEVAELTGLESSSEYEALSYAWEDTTLTHDIHFGESTANEPISLKVTRSCHNALQRLRLPDRGRAIWVDAVCIDQSNLTERSTQIGLMRTIYSKAQQVIVYLGPSHDESDSVMSYLQDLYEPIDFPRQEITIQPPSEEAWNSFFARPWFSRTWVLQEIINGRSVEIYCGDKSLPWEAVERYARWGVDSSHPYPLSTATIEFAKFYRSMYKKRLNGRETQVTPGVNLFKTLQTTRGCLSTDPRDKLYGVLPLLQTPDVVGLSHPDYHMSPEQVFTNLALYLFENVGPEILREGATIRNEGYLTTLPSWVPDWTRVDATKLIGHSKRYMSMKPPGAGGDMIDRERPQELPTANGHITRHLRIRGIRIGSPAKMSDGCDVQKNVFPLKQWRDMAQAAGFYQSKSTFPPLSDKISLPGGGKISRWAFDFFQVITHDEIVYAGAIQKGANLIISWQKDSSSSLPLRDSFQSLVPSYRRQVERVLACCDQRKFAILDNGMMALLPMNTELDDVVYILPGAAVPIILRNRGQHFVFVAECYVQGIMHGEAREGNDDISMEELVLE